MWRTVKLGSIATVIAGQSPKGEHYNKEGRGTPFYQGKKDFGERYLNEPTVWTNVVTKLAEEDDILMSVRAPVGALNIAKQQICIGRGLAAIRPSSEILNDYLFYSLLLISHQLKGSAGAIFNSINKKQIEAIEVSLPPLSEQQRIVAKLDAAFAEIDRAVQLCAQTRLNAELIYANKLTQIFEQKGADWTSSSLKEITHKIGSGATPKGGKSAYKEDGVSLIRSMNVYDMNFSWKELAKIDEKQAEKLSNVTVQQDDVLLNITGASVARCTIVPKEALPARVNQHVAIIRADKSRLIPELLAYGLVARLNKETLLGVGNTAGATRQAITKKDLEEFIFSCPEDLESQRRLIDEISDIKRVSQKLVSVYSKKQDNLIAMKSAILAQELQPPESKAA